MIRKQFAYFFLVSILLTTTLSQDNVGDVCYMRGTKARGICKLSKDCEIAQESARKGISPTLCVMPEFSETVLLCCEVAQNTGSSFTKPIENSVLHTTDNSAGILFPDDNDIPHDPHRSQIGSKSEAKCIEYSKLVTESVAVEVPKCEDKSIPLIVGGKPASPGEFPFMAAIGYNSIDDENNVVWQCGGTLLSEYYVVTAAHCALPKYTTSPVKVRLGELDLTKENDGSKHTDYDIVNIKIHENYRPPSGYNDIALLKLSAKVAFSTFIRPACIWTKNLFDTDKAVATGWGKIGHGERGSDVLLKVTLNIYDTSKCSELYTKAIRKLPKGIQPTMMCAGGEKGRDTCEGDSGGPLVVTKKNTCVFHLIGITSFGQVCGGVIPAVYTRVSEYVTWIEKIVW